MRPVGNHAPTWPRGFPNEVNTIIEVNLEVDLPLFVIPGKLEGRPVRIIIDSGATANFIDKGMVSPQLVAGPKQEVRLANGTPGTVYGTVQREISLGTGYHCECQFKVMGLSPNHQIILGQAWLTPANPRINWASREMDITVMPGRIVRVLSEYGAAKPYEGKGAAAEMVAQNAVKHLSNLDNVRERCNRTGSYSECKHTRYNSDAVSYTHLRAHETRR